MAIAWQEFIFTTIWTITFASDNFDKLHNDILTKISNDLRIMDNDLSENDDAEIVVCIHSVIHVSPLKSLQNYVKVRLGSVDSHQGGIIVDVVGAVRHPKLEGEPAPHADVALLKLAYSIKLSNFINILNIYPGKSQPSSQSFVVVSGWGATSDSKTSFRDHTPDLGSAHLKVRSQPYCENAYQLVNGFHFTPDFFCASLRNGTRDLCLFDAGAPAVQHDMLMGIMTFGPERCEDEFQPAVFIKAFYFRDFVRSTISAYKTTVELIEAIQEMDPMKEQMNTKSIESDINIFR